MPIAKAIKRMFLIMYWPSMVGTKVFCQVTVLSTKRGIAVVTIWIISRTIAGRSKWGIMNERPIIISKIPKYRRNVSGAINGSVLVRRENTKGFAGLVPSTFKSPNQKKVRKTAKRAIGKNI